MSQDISNLSPKASLSPLTIPDAFPDKDLPPEISSSASNLLNHCASFKTDCLLSPVNPATWKGASSHARFGLDIGGTLCKVVYFEPLDESDPEIPSVMKSELGKRGNDVADKPFDSEDFCLHQASECREQGCSSELSNGVLHENASLDCVSDNNLEGSVCGTGQSRGRDDWYYGPLDDNGDYFSSSKICSRVRKLWVSSHDPVLLPGRGTLYFKCFETWRMEEFLFLTKEHSLVTGRRALGATGGGARKFGGQFLEIAGLHLNRADELKSLVRGIDFLMKYAQHESFEYPKAGTFQAGVIQRPLKSPEDSSDESFSEEEGSVPVVHLDKHTLALKRTAVVDLDDFKSGRHEDQPLYPYLVVNIGSGVSILLVESPEHFKRVGGTSLGGSTFFGLASILTGCTSFKEAIDLAAEGDSTEIDMLVGDIYGGDYLEMDLAATTVASSFGKLVQPEQRAEVAKKPQHLAKAVLLMITNNIGALAKLHAQATGVQHVLFTGSFMHGNKLAMRLLSVAMEFWSKGQLKAIFLRHEGHAGAMGALLNALDPFNKTDALLLS